MIAWPGIVHILDRHGARVDEIALNAISPVDCLEWDRDGDCLAILQAGQGVVPIWSFSSRSLTK
jgi:WD repeat-containing protein 19